MSNSQYQQYGGNPYNNTPAAESGEYSQNLGAPAPLNHEMSNYSNQSNYSNTAPALPVQNAYTLTQQDFLSRVDFAKSEIRKLSSHVQEIASLHQRALNSTDNTSSSALENLVTQTQLKNTQIRDQIKFLEHDAAKTTDGTKGTKTRQARVLKEEFEKELRGYQQEELAYKQRYREQIARQYRIVNPQASEAEVNEASELDWGEEGVFQTALKSNRSGQVSSVLGAVRARHNELQRIEHTLTDLAAIFQEMAQLVEVQDPIVERVEENAVQTEGHVATGNEQLVKANKTARATRRKKWWCLLIVVLIVLAIALGIGLGIGLTKKAASTAT
ncbi:t-SNARE [Calycina marina]|uniref:t-SNARE n=1 Tax=Calycina marina TaxID=1763456 RepID=A0A9P8CBK8_9HELO|nr:t-SNARE [Calycina marina]